MPPSSPLAALPSPSPTDALLTTIASCSSEGVRALLDSNASPNGLSACLGFPATPLIIASALGQTEVASLLLRAGASVREAPHMGATALHAACGQEGNASLVSLLLEQRADVNARDGIGCTPLYCACLEAKPDCTKALLEAQACKSFTPHDDC
ncbi:MAG: hypothetical protein SGPRY_014686 [Prymnesium sp.]